MGGNKKCIHRNNLPSHSAEQKLYLKNRLDSIQRHAALMITRGLKSSPTANLEILAGIQPINLKLQEQVLKSALRLKRHGAWDKNYQFGNNHRSNSHAYTIETRLKNIPFSQSQLSDNIPSVLVLDRMFSSKIEDRTAAIRYAGQISEDTLQIYTDGSKQGKLTGAGFSAVRHNEEVHNRHYSLGTIATVFQCELFAIHMGCSWALTELSDPYHIVFLSDSQAAIQALNTPQVHSGLVMDTITQLNKLGTKHKVDLRWIPGHEGVPGNERADELAREGSTVQPIGPEPFLPLPGNFIIKEIRTHLFNQHLKVYKQESISNKGKTPLLHYLINSRYNTPRLPGDHMRWITWLFTGHSPLNYFQHKVNNQRSPMCSFCPGEEETTEHFLCHCIGYMTIRLHTFGSPLLTIEEVANIKPTIIVQFVKRTGRFDKEDLFGQY